MKVFTKADEDVLDYFLDLSNWMPDSDEIESVDVVHDETTALDYQGYNFSETGVKLWFGGGTTGEQYNIKALVHTKAGRTKEVNFIIIAREQ